MIYKRGSSYWYKFRWTVKNQDGSKEHFIIRKSARATNKKDAQTAEDEHRRALRLGEIHPADPWPKVERKAPQVPTLREFSDEFLQFARTHTKGGTARFYEVATARLLQFAQLADVLLSEITGGTIGKYAQWRRDTCPKESLVTVNGDLRTVRRIMNVACEWGRIANAPIIHELPGAKGRERVISYPEEAKYLAAATRTVHDAAILAADTGMRPNSELFPLEWCNVHLECTQGAPHGFIHVPKGKTDAATRNIPLTPRTREMLLARKQLMIGPKEHKRPCGEMRYVFPGDGNSGHLVTVQHAHESAVTDAQIEPFEFYCWRHTFGTRCAESGMDKFSLARLMGHSSPRVAERYYIHVTESHVMTGFERFLEYQTSKLVDAAPAQTDRIQ